MNRSKLILLFLSISTFSSLVFSETITSPIKQEFYDQESNRHRSMLEVSNTSSHKFSESQHNSFHSDSNKQRVDFLKLPNNIKMRNHKIPTRIFLTRQ